MQINGFWDVLDLEQLKYYFMFKATVLIDDSKNQWPEQLCEKNILESELP